MYLIVSMYGAHRMLKLFQFDELSGLEIGVTKARKVLSRLLLRVLILLASRGTRCVVCREARNFCSNCAGCAQNRSQDFVR